MASLPIPSPSFTPVDDIGFIDVEAIEIGQRLRPIDPVHAEVIGRAMLREGQTTPIVVCRLPGRNHWTLVVGGHRVTGARLVGIEQLKAEQIGTDQFERRQREVSENLWRADLSPYDRANFIAELVLLAKLRAGIDPNASAQEVAGGARWQKKLEAQSQDARDTMSHAYGWTEEVADQIGLSRRTLSRDLMLARIAPSEIARLRLRRHPVATNATQLRALAKLEPVEQTKVVSLLLHADARLGEPAKSVAEAWSRIQGRAKAPADAETKRLSAFLGQFGRMGVAEKKGALAALAAQLPAGFRLLTPDDAARPATPAFSNMAEVAEGLEAAFSILIDLSLDGGESVDDDRIHAARSKVHMALLTANTLKKGGAA
ncbi:MAG TPA: ParB N-terminal domain-containing protein [Sphingobium sp.]